MNPVFKRLAWWLQRRRKETELEEELRFHLEEDAAEREDAGESAAFARRSARLDFGNPAVVREDTRAAWGWSFIEQTAQDLRYGARTMRRTPAFTLLAAVSLALGIGANAAIFSFLDAVLLRPLPVRDPASLVRMTWRAAESEAHGISYHDSAFTDAGGYTDGVFSYPAFELFRARHELFSSVFAYQSTGPIALSVQGQTEPGAGEYVSGDYFRGLGVVPAAGRLLDQADDRIGAPSVAVIGFSVFRGRFAALSDAIGQTLLINRKPFTIVGVAPREFFGTDPGASSDVYLPLHSNVLLDENPYDPAPRRYADASRAWLEIMARRQPGVSLAQAQASLAPGFQQLSDDVKANGHRWRQAPSLALTDGARGIDGVRRAYGTPLLLLSGLAALILALACVNIANLLLARGTGRARELAVRTSLGAARVRVVRQLLTESLLLAFLAGAVGIGVALWSQRAIAALVGDALDGAAMHARLDWRVLTLALGVSILTGVLFGLAPAVQATRAIAMPALKEARMGGSVSWRAMRTRRALLLFQVAITLVLLVSAGLFFRTLRNYQAIDLGFSSEHVVTLALRTRQAGLGDAGAIALSRALRARLAALPGVTSVTLSDLAPMGDGRAFTTITVPGRTSQRGSVVLNVGAGFFETMHLRLVRGRGIGERDDRPGAPPVAVVDETFARENFGDADPLGRSLQVPNDAPAVAGLRFEIVGLAANARLGRLTGDREPTVYFPFSFAPWGPIDRMVFEVRTAGDPSALVDPVRAIVREINPNVPMVRISSQTALVNRLIGRQLLIARLCMAFGVLALAIAVIGVYGTVLYSVLGRRAEIGLRMALGARQRQVIGMVLREVLIVLGAGVLVGVPASLVVSKLAGSLLFEVRGGDPMTLAVAVGLLLSAALIAGFVPARAASRIDPKTALRAE